LQSVKTAVLDGLVVLKPDHSKNQPTSAQNPLFVQFFTSRAIIISIHIHINTGTFQLWQPLALLTYTVNFSKTKTQR